MTISRPNRVWLALVPWVWIGLVAADDGEHEHANRRIGQRIGHLSLPATDGSTVALDNLAGKRASVLVFTGTECPVGNLYLPRLVDLAKTFEPRGVIFRAINSNASESMTAIAAHARENAIDWPVLKDWNNVVADALGIKRTCEVVVLDDQARVRYHGAIDDQYVQGARKPVPTANYLGDALTAVVEGKPVALASTPVAGCPIERVDPIQVIAEPARSVRVRPAPTSNPRRPGDDRGGYRSEADRTGHVRS